VATLVVARWEGAIDLDRARQILASPTVSDEPTRADVPVEG
jgi:hypothetical protein